MPPPAWSEKQVGFYLSFHLWSYMRHLNPTLWLPNGVNSSYFLTGQIYTLLCEPFQEVDWHREVWFSGGILKHKFLTWLVVLNLWPPSLMGAEYWPMWSFKQHSLGIHPYVLHLWLFLVNLRETWFYQLLLSWEKIELVTRLTIWFQRTKIPHNFNYTHLAINYLHVMEGK